MADVIGPNSYLPGQIIPTKGGVCCDNHPDRLAESATGQCDWCKKTVDTLAPARDYEEGMYGTVYRVCKPCRKAVYDKAVEEIEAFDQEYRY